MDGQVLTVLPDPDPRRPGQHARDACAAVLVVVTPTHLVWGSCGDARAMLVRDGQVAMVRGM